jgi:hypothetical protein
MGRLRRTAAAVKRLFSRHKEADETITAAPSPKTKTRPAPAHAARPTRITADIPLDVLDRAYTPPDTSSKASFRSDGADHHLDQELAFGVADERWNDEDRFTNKSGDSRIGTHRRTYEPAESGAESRK